MAWYDPMTWGGSSQKTDRKFELQQMGMLQDLASTTGKAGTSALGAGTRDLTSVMNQLQKIIGGGQGGLEAVSPAVNTVASQYQSGRKAAAELSPRGGGRTAELSDSTFREMGDIQRMLFGQQAAARSASGSVAEAIANLGLGEVGTGITASQSVADIASGHMQFAAQQNQQLGQGIGQMLALMMLAG